MYIIIIIWNTNTHCYMYNVSIQPDRACGCSHLAVECYLFVEKRFHHISKVHYSLMLKVVDFS